MLNMNLYPRFVFLGAAVLLTGAMSACGGVSAGDAGTGGSNSGIGGSVSHTGGSSPTGVGGAVSCCLAMPVCDSGDSQIANAAACPSNSTCYSRAACCTQIWCSHAGAPPQDAAVCNPSVEYNRSYVGQSPSACSAIKYACPANTVGFSNSCGCGCEQDASCTQYVDCMPGPATPNPLCSSSLCPYTLRAY